MSLVSFILVLFVLIAIPVVGMYLFGRIIGAGVRDSWNNKNK